MQASAAELEVLLSHAERQRRNALRRNEDRERFLLGRAVLRLQLGHWLERDPASLRLIQGPHGKPALAPEGERTPQFNVAHSGDLILLAFHPRHPVGVDVERQRPDLDWEPVARRVLSAGELRELQVLPAAQRGEAFLAAWCRLEIGRAHV